MSLPQPTADASKDDWREWAKSARSLVDWEEVSGAIVTGSHNAPDYNGLKVVIGGEALSGAAIQGLRQRVAMGRAMVREPRAFLLDEPLSNLDAKLRVQTRLELKKLHERLATTAVYVTHDQVEAMTLADRIAVMEQGRIAQVGPDQFCLVELRTGKISFCEVNSCQVQSLQLRT